MLKNFRYILFVGLLFMGATIAFAQSKPTYKDVLLNGKPAKLNLATGEFILVDGNKIDTIKPLEINDKTFEQTKENTDKSPDVKPKASDSLEVPKDKSIVHTVKAGETLFGLSKKYNVSLVALQKANNLETTLIHVGQKLRVSNLDALDEQSDIADTWIVSKGDTLYSIAKKNNTTVTALKRLNNLKNNLISIGQKLRLK
ncbi:LysM peptidoglycan-binding domain-containing protein [Hyunsoonleella flava]|uniref:LysM peptidoglycan-binding domain-containing protein n=1 Tax=Hyunsoonleella flava TaxID=2527939 RepID=A0A4Q9FI56_9FLAO|nr:LysM peptidoglycan-binding domain-containing protein [Hyunsoonleella flava]TBN06652.1 LysM peptidoglycan-binding domain-containing protein [Hyunsoonleella flava]